MKHTIFTILIVLTMGLLPTNLQASEVIKGDGQHVHPATSKYSKEKFDVLTYVKSTGNSLDVGLLPLQKGGPALKLNQSNTHIYAVLPNEVILTVEYQVLPATRDFEKMPPSMSFIVTPWGLKFELLLACSPKDEETHSLFGKYNSSLEGGQLTAEEMDKVISIYNGELLTVKETDKNLRTIGYGDFMSPSEFLPSEVMMVKSLREKYGPDFHIYKVPFHTLPGTALEYAPIGLYSTLGLDSSKLSSDKKAFVEIFKAEFSSETNDGGLEIVRLEDLSYEVTIKSRK